MKGPGPTRGTVLAEINVTPMVDVMLVLLIIFMVAAPMIQQGVSVNLPQIVTTDLPSDPDLLVVTVDRTGNVFVGKSRVGLSSLAEKLKAINKRKGTRESFLRADKDVPYGVVVEVMAAMREAGIERLGMVTEQLEAM